MNFEDDAHPYDPPAGASGPDSVGARADLALADAALVAGRVRDRLLEAILGRDDVVDLVVISLLAGGHVLLEDFPGSGKTMLARALGEAIEPGPGAPDPAAADVRIAPFRRIQFTPDLLPSDITGVSVFQPERGTFEFLPGPVFAHIVLADEINRTSPKVQSALLEAMAERQVTVDNVTHPLDALFLVIATQNPLGLAGTFPLPAPQLDRFLFKVRMTYIDREAELRVVSTFRQRLHPAPSPLPRAGRDALVAARGALEQHVYVAPALEECLVDIARALREDERVAQGISTRALVQAVPALQARALLRGRDFVTTGDIDDLAVPLFAHRLALGPGTTDPLPIVRDALRGPLEAATRATLRR
jgi:MoxR-like ATPase